uniref:Uncharacterized protein n=1 Tax=viral metagenome TaxID=1070528 RepID=A0A6M3KN94_9ZZZZ
MSVKLTSFQIDKMKLAKKGFCFDSDPSTWNYSSERNEMERLVKRSLMVKLKNHPGDKHGFYALTVKGRAALALAAKEE